jgi:hypothetical protein
MRRDCDDYGDKNNESRLNQAADDDFPCAARNEAARSTKRLPCSLTWSRLRVGHGPSIRRSAYLQMMRAMPPKSTQIQPAHRAP